MTRAKAIMASIAAGVAIVALGFVLPDLFGFFVFWPGGMMAALVWPEGIHSDCGICWLVSAILISWLIWCAVVYGVIRLVGRYKSRDSRKIAS